MKDNSFKNIKEDQFVNIIFKLRTKRNLTQKMLADIIHVSDRTISKWENGLTVPDLINIRNICKELHVSPNSVILDKLTIKDYFYIAINRMRAVIDYILKNIFAIGFIIAFILLLIYFINNYNAVSIYSIEHSNADITIEHGYFLKSKGENILLIDNISINNMEYVVDEIHMELFTYVNGDKYLIYQSDKLEDIYIEELSSYPILLKGDVIEAMCNNMYLEIHIIDTKGKTHKYNSIINLKKEFSNNSLSYSKYTSNEKYDSPFSAYLTNDIIAYSVNEEIKYNYDRESDNLAFKPTNNQSNKLGDLGYYYDDYLEMYFKNESDHTISYHDKNNFIEYEKNNNNEKVVMKYFLDFGWIDCKIWNKEANTIVDFRYFVDQNKIECIASNCENYRSEIDYILSIYNEIMSIL